MSSQNNNIEVMCRECGRVWTRRLLTDVNTLSEAALNFIKTGTVCVDCRLRRNEELTKLYQSRHFTVTEEED